VPVSAICGCGLPAFCCQPAVAGGIIYADLWGEFSAHLALQALFTQSSPVHKPLLQAFPFPSTLWEVTLHPLSQADVFVYSSYGRWVFPPLLWIFPPCATLKSFPCPSCWVRTQHASTPAGASLARPSLFIYSSRKNSPPPLFRAQCSPPSLQRVFIVLIAYYSVSLFSPGVGLSVQGAILGCSGPGLSVGVLHTAKLILSVSSQAVWVQATGGTGALLVSPFNMKWRCSVPGTGVEGSKFCLFSVVLPARCVSSVSPRFHYRWHTFCFLPLATILESTLGDFFNSFIHMCIHCLGHFSPLPSPPSLPHL
jgi:hypothetical protein